MYLEKLEIQGFKSFAKKTVLEFPGKIKDSNSITGVVGPNGSGKSNVADSLRWVLGEQSIKTLRGKKSQDVIFMGSDKKARLGFAEVSLYLNNQDKEADFDYPELVITRRVYQSGEGEYFINKNKARLTDIQMLLAKANFGQRTYSIIGQGMADSVLSASLQERKELLDEAVGVKQFQIKREQALNKFKATRENLAQTALTLQELDPRLKSLTRQVKKLEKREEIAKELQELQLNYYARLWQSLAKKIADISIQKTNAEKFYQSLNNDINEIQVKINQFSTANSRQEEFAKIQAEYNLLVSQKNNLLGEQTILKAKIDINLEQQGQGNFVWLKKRLAEISQQIKNYQLRQADYKNQLEPETNNLHAKQQLLLALDQRLHNVKTELTKIQATTQVPFEQEKEIEAIFNQQQSLLNQLINVKALTELEKIKNEAREISQKLAVYLEKLKTNKKQDSANLLNLQNQLESLGREKNDLALEINQLTINITLKKDKIDTFTQEIATLQQEHTKTSQELELNEFKPKNQQELDTKITDGVKAIEKKISKLNVQISQQEEKIREFNIAEQNKKETLINLQKDFQDKQQKINHFGQEINQYNIELAKYSTRQEDLETEIRHDQLELAKISKHAATENLDEDLTYQKVQQLKRQMEIIGSIDNETQNEYNEIKERYDFLTTQSQDLESAIGSLEKIIEELDKTIKEQFDKAFSAINKEFQQYFKILFNGGQAELVKVSAEDVKKEAKEEVAEANVEEDTGILAQADKFAKRLKAREKESYSGIEIHAVPPGKKIKTISMLSGGERALTSIALICAIIYNNPSPFIVLDEVDAALDEANSERFNSILEQLAKKTQFIVITHNRVTMHYADVLYGVTMGDDSISKLLSVKLADAEDMIGAA